MTDAWPTEVIDCALRLAKSLGYRDDHILAKNGCVYVKRLSWSPYWRELDPRDPTVWGALIGPHTVYGLNITPYNAIFAFFKAKSGYSVSVRRATIDLAVCEAYNALKGNIKCTTSK